MRDADTAALIEHQLIEPGDIPVALKKFINKRMERRPMILPIIMEI